MPKNNHPTSSNGPALPPSSPAFTKDSYRKGFLIALVLLLLIAFLIVIRDLVVTIGVSASLSSLAYPWRVKLERALKGRRELASALVLCLVLVIVGIPLLIVLTIAAREAVQITESVLPWLKEQMNKPVDQWVVLFERFPFYHELKLYQANFFEGFSTFLQSTGSYLTQTVKAATSGTVEFFFKTFVAIYSAFFFLNDGERLYKSVAGYLPLTPEESQEMGRKMLIIIRSTIKSIFVIGAVQGFLLAVALWAVGIKTAIFWGILGAVLSAIPGLGAPLIWVPTVIYLLYLDRILPAVGLAAWGVLVIGLADNFLRPIIVGKDSKVPELLIFLAMIGGLSVFGLAGLVLGPVLVGLLLSVLHIYKKAFQRLLDA